MVDAQDVRRWVAAAVALTRLPALGSEVYYFPEGHANQWGLPAPEAAQAMLACTVASVEFFPAGDEPYARVSLVPADHVDEPVADTRPAADSYVYHQKVLVQADVQRQQFAVPKVCAESLFPMFEDLSTRQQISMSDVSGYPFLFEYKLMRRKHELHGEWGGLVRRKVLDVGDSVLFVRRSSDHRLFVEGRRPQPPVQQDPGEELALAAQGGAFSVTYSPGRGDLFIVPRGAVDDALGKHWDAGMEVGMRANDRVHAVGEQAAQLELVTGSITSVIPDKVWHSLKVTIDGTGAPRNMNAWDVEATGAQPPAAKRARIVPVDEGPSNSMEPATSMKLMGVVIETTATPT